MKDKPFISAIIKTFNEEEGIAATIQSIREQIGSYPYKIIVADSLSTDKTQEIALENGATVVSLTNSNERCCGVGHQLGYLHSEGDYLLLLDGDMQLEAGFVDHAITFMEENTNYAGVAGLVEMDDAANYEFKSRKQRINQIYPVGDCDHLGGGGLYRKSAIDEIGYLTNRNLHAFEEAELGMRLTKSGYKLHRLAVPYFHHTSYDMSTFELIKYRWRSGYLFATGELLRNSFGSSHFTHALKIIKNEVIFALYLLILASSLLTLNPTSIGSTLLPLVAFVSLKAVKNRSLHDATQSVINLTIISAGLIRGLFNPVKNPFEAPDNKVIQK
ncbi:glycosyltransferase [Vibrio hannami]|uniref:glycosyltransferase n=1 Tax=Vibrio hannami TaxID=2717094 RepID=UPI00240EA24C|nr:glycosyltransferase [Vibrio hannami]MDG3087038.1 glycosyltransferase [Vibrio hannami]